MSHLKTIGVSVGQGRQRKRRREINIPREGTINRALGRKKSPNRKRVTKSFKDPEEATKAAKKLSRSFDRKR